MTEQELKPLIEALVYVTQEPISLKTFVELFGKEHQEPIQRVLQQLVEEYQAPERGLEIKEVANGFKMATKPEHHEWVRKYLKHLSPPAKLSLAALETLAVIAYKQPITVPEIQEVRGVSAVSVLKTLLDKKLIATAGRKNVVGRPILYKTSKEFLVHFGLKSLEELPSLEEFEELAKSSLSVKSPTEPAAEDSVTPGELSVVADPVASDPLVSEPETSWEGAGNGQEEAANRDSEELEPKSLSTESQ
ncbi:MAG: SMC-Scp complex subunit ScpB [Terriglobia bacterium]